MSTQQPLAALISPRTVHVNTVGGSDSNPGTESAPYLTLARAWQERKRYLQLRAQFTVQLHGVGPYTMPVIADSEVDIGQRDLGGVEQKGLFVLRGDPAARVVLATGTLTGDIAGFVLPTTAGVGGVNTRRHDFVLITSGNCAGASFLITDNTDTSITVANKQARVTNGLMANGNTFEVIRPGTVVNTPNPPSGEPSGGFYNLIGGDSGPYNADPGHWVYDIEFTGQLRFSNAAIMLLQCRLTNGMFPIQGNQLRFGMLQNSSRLGVGVGAGAANLLWGAGAPLIAFASLNRSVLHGVVSWGAGFNASIGAQLFWAGGIAAGALTCFDEGTQFNAWGLATTDNREVIVTITIEMRAQAKVPTNGWTFAVTAGSCWRIKTGGQLLITQVNAMAGGTTDAAGYGIDVRGGGQCICGPSAINNLTGGTPGSDLRTTATAVAANAVLGAVPSTVDALGSPYGEVLARVA